MLIEIKPDKKTGQFVVIAHSPSGLIHDYLPTQQDAIDTALALYGGTIEQSD